MAKCFDTFSSRITLYGKNRIAIGGKSRLAGCALNGLGGDGRGLLGGGSRISRLEVSAPVGSASRPFPKLW